MVAIDESQRLLQLRLKMGAFGKMNNFLASMASVLNSLLAIAFIVIGTILGFFAGDAVGSVYSGLMVGALIGVAFAVIVCGMLALMISIRDELANIRKTMKDIRDHREVK